MPEDEDPRATMDRAALPRPSRTFRRVMAAGLAALLAGPALADAETGFFGTAKSFEFQPQVDAYYHLQRELRLLLQVQGTLSPDTDDDQVAVGLYADWLLAPLLRELITPDLAKTHLLQLRLGARYTSPETVALQLDVTPRYYLPWNLHVSARNRVLAQWDLRKSEPFTFIYRGRLQIEREFPVGHVGLTPFANVEWYWESPPAMWERFSMQGGVQCAFGGIGRGQILEVNYSQLTYLQPGRSWRPVVGLRWYVFF